jgi:hypothetical protein
MEDININSEDIEKFQNVCDGASLLLMTVGAVTIAIGALRLGKGIGKAVLWNHDRKIRKQMQMDQKSVIDV